MVLGASALRGVTGLWSLMFYPRIPSYFNRCRWYTIGYLIRIIIRSPNGAGFYIFILCPTILHSFSVLGEIAEPDTIAARRVPGLHNHLN